MNDKPFLLDMYLRRDKPYPAERYPFKLPVVRALAAGQVLAFHPKITYFVGENGSGKSTLLEALAVNLGFNPEGGSRHFRFASKDTHSELSVYLRVGKYARAEDGFFLRAESFYNAATYTEAIGLDGHPLYGGRALHQQSHGESFWSLLQHRFQGRSLYLLDELESALSPQRQLAVLARLHELAGQGAQFVIVTHSPILLAYPDALIWQCSADGIEQTAYEDTETFRSMKLFMDQPQRMVAQLLGGK